MTAGASLGPRYVVFHRPGPAWQAGVDFREQPGVMAHVQHYAQWHAQGRLALGGPFLTPDAGGMMVTTRGASAEELTAFAASDPAVQSGLLVFEVRPWHTPFEAS